MASITLRGNPVKTSGDLPSKGATAKNFSLVKEDLSEVTLDSYKGKKKLLNIFPSLDTGTCANSVRKFALAATALKDVIVIDISKDLPFAQKRFCTAENINGVEVLSAFRSSFAKDYGLEITDGPLAGLCSRAVIILDENNHVLYTEQVSEIGQEPNYDKALEILKTGT